MPKIASFEPVLLVMIFQELAIDIAKTHLWMKRVSRLLGPKFAKELAATYVQVLKHY